MATIPDPVVGQPAAAPSVPGLSSAEARRRLDEFGPNAIQEAAPPSWRVLLGKFWAPVPWMLEAAILLQLALGEYLEAAVVGALLLFNAILGFVQEGRASAALQALKNRLAPTALVRRDEGWVRLPASELVPGDAISLPLGAIVPADALILEGEVSVDESMLTGESAPIDAAAGGVVHASALVRRGQAIAEVKATGAGTSFGRTAELVRIAHAISTEQVAVFAATRNLALMNGVVALCIVVFARSMAWPVADLVRIALVALLGTIPVALPATFTLSAAFGARRLARQGVLLTRLTASHEAAAMDVLCADKTGTLTRNSIQVAELVAMPGFEPARVLELASLASAETDQDPIDAAIRAAAKKMPASELRARVLRFIPFDPDTRMSQAFLTGGDRLRVVKGAFQAVARATELPRDARRQVDDLAARGHRVIAVATGTGDRLQLAGLVALSDPPREDSAGLIAALRQMKVRTVMVTGDSPVTAAAIAREVGIRGGVCAHEQLAQASSTEEFGVFARVLPEEKYELVKALQRDGHVVGMCGDGTNDAPALRQAQIGIAVASATDVAKAGAGMVMTEPGLGGIVLAVREGRIGFQRLLTYTLNTLVRKIEIVLFLGVGLVLTGQAIITPVLMVLLFMTNDFLSMSLTTDRAVPGPGPSVWRMRGITAASIVLGVCKLGFSTALLAFGAYRLDLTPVQLQTMAFVSLAAGNQAVLYVLRERGPLWRSRPGAWVLGASLAGICLVSVLAVFGVLMAPLPWTIIACAFGAAAGFMLVLDRIKLAVMSVLEMT